jgi:uracil phosphoribosyltransferase
MKRYFETVRTKYLLSISLVLLLSLPSYTNTTYAPQDFPIVKSSLQTSKHERVLMTQLRDKTTSRKKFRKIANQLAELLVSKVVECLDTIQINIETPVAPCMGEIIDNSIELVSVMRSGDALLRTFGEHYPFMDSAINKILIQRNEETAKPEFKYKKFSPTLLEAKTVIITEPMIATGGSLTMTIDLLKKCGIKECNIIVAAICAAPEGLIRLSNQYPELRVVVIAIDDHLNERSYITPGIGDFGDRYFGTE